MFVPSGLVNVAIVIPVPILFLMMFFVSWDFFPLNQQSHGEAFFTLRLEGEILKAVNE